MTRVLVLLLGAVCSGAPAGVISGTVVDKNSERPVRRAIVTLSTTEARPQEAVAWSDSEGRFAFGYLAAGRYRLTVFKMGYQFTAYGAEGANRRGAILTLAEGENKSGLVMKLAPSAAITGIVLDEDGDPISGAQVSIFHNVRQRRSQVWQPANSGVTDGRGQYRIANVLPGEYLVGVNIESEAAKGKPEVSITDLQERYVFEQQFYPAVSDPKSASKIRVVSGQDTSGINFRLQALPMATLRGKVIVPAGVDVGNGLQVTVMQNATGQRQMRGAFAPAPEYAFVIPGLRPGLYRLVAQASVPGKEYRGVQQVQLGRENDVTLALEASVDISGSVKVEGPGAEKYNVANVELTPGDEVAMGRPVRAGVNKDGTFKLASVMPGVWDINASPVPPGGYIKSMRLGEQDVLTEEMTITSSTALPLHIVVSTAGAVVDGTVEGAEPGLRYQISLVPSGRFEHVDSFRKFATTDENFHFEMKGITPGSYKLYAFTQLPGPDLKSYEAEGIALELKEGERLTRKLKPIAPGGQNQ